MQQIDNINSTSSHASREEKWDFLRGIAIFLVLLGHSIQWIDPEWQHNLLFEGIYSFHMPLFMFISGYFLRKNLQEVPFWEWQKQKARQLFLPSVVNSIVFIIRKTKSCIEGKRKVACLKTKRILKISTPYDITMPLCCHYNGIGALLQ